MVTTTITNGSPDHLANPTDGARGLIAFENPYSVEFTIEGIVPILFHAWNNESIEEKSKAKKNSAVKKTDNIESYVYRCNDGTIGIPGVYIHGAIQHAAKFRQDPRSPRKSAFDLYRAAIAPLEEVTSLGKKEWDYLDIRRVTVQRNGITRTRPAFHAGWRATFRFMVNLPEYVGPADLLDVLGLAGRVIGVADFRPTYGRFAVVNFEALGDA